VARIYAVNAIYVIGSGRESLQKDAIRRYDIHYLERDNKDIQIAKLHICYKVD
jgi:hypothetical protein